jgi:hypothetical protein
MFQIDLSMKEVTGSLHSPCYICGRQEEGVPRGDRDRFFQVAGKGFEGEVACETCLIIAHAIARKQRQEVKDGIR